MIPLNGSIGGLSFVKRPRRVNRRLRTGAGEMIYSE
jgi:hypothetical protein